MTRPSGQLSAPDARTPLHPRHRVPVHVLRRRPRPGPARHRQPLEGDAFAIGLLFSCYAFAQFLTAPVLAPYWMVAVFSVSATVLVAVSASRLVQLARPDEEVCRVVTPQGQDQARGRRRRRGQPLTTTSARP